MKKVLTVLLLAMGMAAPLWAQDSAIDKYFSQYVEDDRFSVIFISPKMFQMLGNMDINGLEGETEDEIDAIKGITKELKALRILTTDVTPDKFYKEFKSKINTKEYEPLMTIKGKDGENIEFLAKGSNGETIDELLLLVHDDEFVMLSFMGKINLNKVSKLTKSIKDKEQKKEHKKED